MKKHDIGLIAAWAKENGIDGYDHLDPKVQEQRRQWALKKHNERLRKEEQKKFSKEHS